MKERTGRSGLPPAIVEKIVSNVRQQSRTALLESEAKMICQAYQLPVPDFGVAKDRAQAAGMAEKVTYPVVLKIVSPDILHKTEAGGVLLNMTTKNDVETGFDSIVTNAKGYNPNVRIEGVLVQHMVPKGVEIIIGGLRDRQFGPTVMFGLGGIFVEVLKDVTFEITPLDERDALGMIHRIQAHDVLKGFRGQPPADEEAIVALLRGVSRMMDENSIIEQLDLNPVMVYEKGTNIVDARILLAQLPRIKADLAEDCGSIQKESS